MFLFYAGKRKKKVQVIYSSYIHLLPIKCQKQCGVFSYIISLNTQNNLIKVVIITQPPFKQMRK